MTNKSGRCVLMISMYWISWHRASSSVLTYSETPGISCTCVVVTSPGTEGSPLFVTASPCGSARVAHACYIVRYLLIFFQPCLLVDGA